ncbi:helix-turn-helix transcriptional regulator [Streptomyces sp. YU58]|uniref:helix-turn-helix transcriptional regulator n=1 Tax=Streptomyces sp. SX92 TaxID=3158972 RepID=UPI0027B958D8|nr:LuxR family transcriptional regulator [Streptomyces coralus]WLW52465.1 AAA family ATPase [Streptomyces coralus]
MRLVNVPLTGRQQQLAVLSEALAALRDGRGGCLIVEGPAGIGKSRLLTEAMARARLLGLATAEATSVELDRIVPLHTLLTALRSGSPPVLDARASRELAGRLDNRYLVLDSLGEAVAEFAVHRPLVIAIDDAQWTDELSALAARILIPALSTSPVLWLLGWRPEAVSAPVAPVIATAVADGATRLELQPLPEAGIAEFCRHALHAEPDPDLVELVGQSGGNPFLLEQLLHTLVEEGRIRVEDGTARTAGDQDAGMLLSPSSLAAISRQLTALGPLARRLLDTAAVLGRPFTLHEAAGLAGVPMSHLLEAVEETVRAGVLHPAGSELAFVHDLLRQGVYQMLAGPVRHALHREASVILRSQGSSALETAEHVLRSARKGDRHSVDLLAEAAQPLAERAPGTGAELLLHAVRLSADHDERRPQLASQAIRMLAEVGRLSDCHRLAEEILATGADPDAEAAIRLGVVDALKHAGRNAESAEAAEKALQQPGLSGANRALLLSVQAHALLYDGELSGLPRADAAAVEAIALGSAESAAPAVVFGRSARSVAAWARGDLTAAVDEARQAVRLAEEQGDAAARRHPALWLGRALGAQDRLAEAAAVLEAGQREARRLGTAWSYPLWHYHHAELAVAAGQLQDAATEAEAGSAVAEQLEVSALRVPLLCLSAEIALRCEGVQAARELLDAARRLVESGIGLMPEDLAWPQAMLQVATGETAAAYATLADVYRALPDRQVLPARDPANGPALVRLALRAGRRPQAEAAAAAAAGLAGREGSTECAAAAAQHAEALLRGGRHGGRLLRDAVEKYRVAGLRPLALAAALEDAGQAAQSGGSVAQALADYREAAAGYEACGAVQDSERVLRAVRALGARNAATAPAPKSGWAALTSAELRVARLVAEGLTNRAAAERLFLSPHTVDTHLRHVFAKLAVSSRVELTRLVVLHEG